MIRRSIGSFFFLLSFLAVACFSTLTGQTSAEKDSLYQVIQTSKDNRKIVEASIALSQHYSKYHSDSAIYYSKKALLLVAQSEDSSLIGQKLQELRFLDFKFDSLENIRIFLLDAVSYFDDCDCDSLKAMVYYHLGKVYFYSSNYIESQEYFLEGITYAEKLNSPFVLQKIYSIMGHLYHELQDYEGAKQIFVKSLETVPDGLDETAKIYIHYNLARAHIYSGDFIKANDHIQNAFLLAQKLNRIDLVVPIYYAMGELKYAQMEYDQAIDYFNIGKERIVEIELEYPEAEWYLDGVISLGKGKSLYHLTRYEEAVDVFMAARQMAIDQGLSSIQSEASEYLSYIFRELGDFERALDYCIEYEAISDSLFSFETVARINNLEAEYRHLKELNQQKLEEQILKAEHANEVRIFQIITLTGFFLFCIVVLIFILYRSKQRNRATLAQLEQSKALREKEMLEAELDLKNREMTTSVIYLLKKNNFLMELSSKLKKAILPLNPEAKKPIQDIIKETDANIGNDAWDDFQIRFNNVHQGFSEKLLKDFPDLTPNELKLCAFLRLNMSTKEISTITYQSANSITVARHRLRTKLGVEREENLVSFLTKY